MNISNQIIEGPNEQGLYILGGKPTADPTVSICLMNTLDGAPNYSLWNAKYLDEETVVFSIYDGADSEAVKLELLQKFVANAFQKDEKEKIS